MNNFPVAYLVDNRVLATSLIVATIQPRSLAYVCTTCGNLWGRVVVEALEDVQTWETVSAPCALHLPRGVVDWGHVPGSFLSGKGNFKRSDLRVTAWGRALEHLPDVVLKREFELTMKHFERIENGNESQD